MRFIENFSIKTRLLIMSAIIIVFFTFFSVLAMTVINNIINNIGLLYNNSIVLFQPAYSISADLNRIHRSMKDVAMADDQYTIDKALHDVAMADSEILSSISMIEQNLLDQKGDQVLHELRNLYVAWQPIRETVIKAKANNNNKEAQRITREEGAHHLTKLHVKQAELIDHITKLSNQFIKDVYKIKKIALMTFLISAILFISIAAILSVLVINSITRPLGIFNKTIMRNTEKGELNPVIISGRNEITDVADGFNILVSDLKEQYWIDRGVKALYADIYIEEEFLSLAQKSVQFLAEYMNIPLAALYKYNDKSNRLHLISTTSNTDGSLLEDTCSLDNGLLGQVARTQKSLLINNVSADHLKIKTAFSEGPPVNIYIHPLIINEELFGVIELATFEEFTKQQIEFIDIADNIITTRLYIEEQQEEIKSKSIEILKQHMALRDSHEKLTVTNEELQSKEEELISQNEELQAKEEELISQFRELEKINEKLHFSQLDLEKAHQHKDRFISSMSHELRTPLNAILGFSQSLQKKYWGELNEKQMEYIQLIIESGQLLLALINDILDLAQIEAGSMGIKKELTDIKPLLIDIVTLLSYQVNNKNLRIEYNIDSSITEVLVDTTKFKQIILNLLTNAIKFTEPAGQITIKAEKTDDNMVKISIIDTGTGINESEFDKIFTEFYQSESSKARKEKGTGIGLALTKRLVELHQGKIGFCSKINEGSTFWFTLPETETADES
jgi:signal transduction histidine kinase